MPHRRRSTAMRRAVVAITAALVATSSFAPAVAIAAAPVDDAQYIVQLGAEPLATAVADVDGGAAAFESGEAVAADAVLQRAQLQAATSVGADIDQSFTAVFNGFSATLSAQQVAELVARDDVLSVSRERVFTQDAVTSAEALGLSGSTGVWNDIGGADDAGAGVVVGMIDSGIAPENPAFDGAQLAASSADPTIPHLDGSATGGVAVSMEKADGGTFAGVCEVSATFGASACSTKIVGARVFDDGPTSGAVLVREGTEYLSPRDASGHGSHTSAIAVGNADVPATTGGVGPVEISGVAPAAKVAVYKACWLDALFGSGRCAESDLVAAIDAAVRDGVDVINYSIGSGAGDESVSGPVDLALLRAATAGVFVAASAGNSGPAAGTVDHTEPWVTTVAASSTERGATVVIGSDEYPGISSTVYGTATTDVPLVQDRSNPASLYCRAGSLDPAIVRDAVVLCLRTSSGDSATIRLAASTEVRQAGGVGMIMANTATSASALPAEAHAVPTVHVTASAGSAIAAAAAAGDTVSLLPSLPAGTASIDPAIADFSSRGPAVTGYGNILKPDLAAPGVQVLSAAANAPGADPAFRLSSGTSMASPQVAGLAALALAVEPDSSPAAVRSALMTTARAVAGDAFAEGAGVVLPSSYLEPGFVYDAGADDWNGYLNGLGAATGTRATPLHGCDLNQPSLAIASLVGARTVERTLTSTGAGSFDATAAVPGIGVSVVPAHIEFTAPGQRATISVTVTAGAAALDTFAAGAITWRGTTTSARTGDTSTVTSTFPIVARPVAQSTEPPLAELPAISAPEPEPTSFPGPISTTGPIPPDPDDNAVQAPTPRNDPTAAPDDDSPTSPDDESTTTEDRDADDHDTSDRDAEDRDAVDRTDTGDPDSRDDADTDTRVTAQALDESSATTATPTPAPTRTEPTSTPGSTSSAVPSTDDVDTSGGSNPVSLMAFAAVIVLILAAGIIVMRLRGKR